MVDESSVVINSGVDESSVPPKSSNFGRREFCPLVDESSVVDESSFSRFHIGVTFIITGH